MNTLTFIRHAETDMAGTFCGHCDPELNARGEAQVAALLAGLEGQMFTAVHSSDLRRAVTTAVAVANKFSLPLVVSRGLREIYFGDWEGLRWNEIERRDLDFARRWLDQYPTLGAPGGEAIEDFQERVLLAVRGLLASGDEQRVAVVTHGGVMRVVLRRLLGRSEEQAWVETNEFCASFVYAGDGFDEVRP